MQRDSDHGNLIPPVPGKLKLAFAAETARTLCSDEDGVRSAPAERKIAAKAQRLLALVKERDRFFRRPVMADRSMSVMLSLFLAELQAVPLTEATLALITLLERDEERGIVETLIHAGLAARTGDNPERRTVGLTALRSARMRSFISDYPDF